MYEYFVLTISMSLVILTIYYNFCKKIPSKKKEEEDFSYDNETMEQLFAISELLDNKDNSLSIEEFLEFCEKLEKDK